MGHVVVIHNQKGGTGKSTTATTLATLLALLQRDVILVDSDPQANATDAMGFKKRRLKGGRGYAEFLTAKKTGRTIVKRRVQRAGHVGHIAVLTASRERLITLEAQLQHPLLSLNTEMIAEKLDGLTEIYDYVIVDTAPGVTHLTVAALKAADVIITPMLPTEWALEGIKQVLSTLEAVRESDVPVWPLLVMTTNNKATRQSIEKIRSLFGDTMFEQTIRRSGSIEGYEKRGKTLVQVRSTSTAAQDYIKFTQEFLERMESE